MQSRYGVRVAGWPVPIAPLRAPRVASACVLAIARVPVLLLRVCWIRYKAAKHDGHQGVG